MKKKISRRDIVLQIRRETPNYSVDIIADIAGSMTKPRHVLLILDEHGLLTPAERMRLDFVRPVQYNSLPVGMIVRNLWWILVSCLRVAVVAARTEWQAEWREEQRRREPGVATRARAMSPMRRCDYCGEHISYQNGGSKAKHFLEKHPQFHFHVVRIGRNNLSTYWCDDCGLIVPSFAIMVSKHNHTEEE